MPRINGLRLLKSELVIRGAGLQYQWRQDEAHVVAEVDLVLDGAGEPAVTGVQNRDPVVLVPGNTCELVDFIPRLATEEFRKLPVLVLHNVDSHHLGVADKAIGMILLRYAG